MVRLGFLDRTQGERRERLKSAWPFSRPPASSNHFGPLILPSYTLTDSLWSIITFNWANTLQQLVSVRYLIFSQFIHTTEHEFISVTSQNHPSHLESQDGRAPSYDTVKISAHSLTVMTQKLFLRSVRFAILCAYSSQTVDSLCNATFLGKYSKHCPFKSFTEWK